MRDLRIAWRSILRHARRTVITVSALVVGLTGIVVFQGFLGQMMQGFQGRNDTLGRRAPANCRERAVLRGWGVQPIRVRP